MKYEIITNRSGEEVLKRTDADGTEWFIPIDTANSDYQAYLESLENEA